MVTKALHETLAMDEHVPPFAAVGTSQARDRELQQIRRIEYRAGALKISYYPSLKRGPVWMLNYRTSAALACLLLQDAMSDVVWSF